MAAAQALDPTFTPPASLYSTGAVYSMAAQQADGKRVVAGYFTRANNAAVGSLVRLDAAGALDATFAQNVGLARAISRVKALPSGQYLVGGLYNEVITAGGLTRPSLLRLQASGLADASFNAGTGAASPNNGYVQLHTFVGQPDGKVLVGGIFQSFSGRSTAGLVRLLADGSLDAAFNANLGTGFNDAVNTVVMQPDGKLLVGGSFSALNGQAVSQLVRLNADGTRDASFTTLFDASTHVDAVLVQPDGQVLAAGYLTNNGNTRHVVRLTTTGAVDTGFANLGSTLSYNGGFYDTNLLLQPDGKVLLGGMLATSSSAYVVRLNANGTPDNSFVVSNGPDQYPNAIGLQSDGSVLAGGSFNAFGGRETALGRLSSTGALDASFLPKLQAPGSVQAVVRQADGQLLLGGDFTEYNGVAVHRAVRVSATGTLDAAYAAAVSGLAGGVRAMALQPDGKLLVASRGGLRRLLTTGTPDASYGTFAATAYVEALLVQPDGRAVLTGYFNNVPVASATSALVRLTASGDYDTSFAPGTTSGPGYFFYGLSLALQPDGKLLVGGSYQSTSGNATLRVVRYESTGAVDPTFSYNTPFDLPASAGGYVVRLNTLALQPDGQVLVGGYFTSVNGTPRANLARLTATGLLDATFVAPTTLDGAVVALALQPNGRLLVGSGAGNDGTPATSPLVRVLATGALDSSFGSTATPNDAVAALLVQPNGAIVMGGSFTTVGAQASPGLARLTAPNVLAVGPPSTVTPFSVWPVPVREFLHATAEAGAQGAELLDALGRVVRQQALPGAGEFTLATAGLPAGVYVLRVQYGSGMVARRVAVE